MFRRFGCYRWSWECSRLDVSARAKEHGRKERGGREGTVSSGRRENRARRSCQSSFEFNSSLEDMREHLVLAPIESRELY